MEDLPMLVHAAVVWILGSSPGPSRMDCNTPYVAGAVPATGDWYSPLRKLPVQTYLLVVVARTLTVSVYRFR